MAGSEWKMDQVLNDARVVAREQHRQQSMEQWRVRAWRGGGSRQPFTCPRHQPLAIFSARHDDLPVPEIPHVTTSTR